MSDRARSRAEDLEARARQLDELTAAGGPSPDVATISAKRRFLLLDMEAAGLFARTPPEGLLPELPAMPELGRYRDAALRLGAYLSSAKRAEFFGTTAPPTVAEARISLDWFRYPQPMPQGFEAEEWLAYCEFMSKDAQMRGDMGEIFFTTRDRLCTLRWRVEDGVRKAIYAVTL